MSQDDSEASDGESSYYTTTNVLLGYSSKEPTNDNFSKLGGSVVWPNPVHPPSSALAQCKNCNAIMTLLLRLLADLPDSFPGHERRLYIFSCKKRACRRKDGSMRVIRGTKIVAQTQQDKDEASTRAQHKFDEIRRQEQDQNPSQASLEQKPRLGDSIFNSTFETARETRPNPFAKPQNQLPMRPLNDHFHRPLANPFASPSPSKPPQNSPSHFIVNQNPPPTSVPDKDLAETFAEKVRITATVPKQQKPPPRPWPPSTDLPEPYPSYYLDADIETLDPTPPASLSKPTPAMEIDPITNDPLDKDAFESHLDTTFQKFADRVSQNPEQVLRYEYGGQPLLYSSTDAVGKIFAHNGNSQTGSTSGVKIVTRSGGGKIPNCDNCGTGRVFECQLMPAAITALEADEEGLDGMEWGSVIVGVCGRDCTEGDQEGDWGWREEWCGVQWEEIK